MAIRDLRVLTLLVIVMVIIDALWNPIILLGAAAFPIGFRSLITPIASTVDTGFVIFRLATVVMFCCWIYIAGRNLVAADVDDLDFTPGARIWWFAVPFANLVKPFQGMRELWNASRNVWPVETNNAIVAIWWAVWLGSGFFAWIARFAIAQGGSALTFDYVEGAIGVVRAAMAVILLRGISEGQRQVGGEALSEVFA